MIPVLGLGAGARRMCALAIVLGTVASAGAQTVVDPLQAAGDGSDLVLVAGGARARLIFPNSHQLALVLPARGELTALAKMADS
jgi:hypothetical protein